MKSALSRRGFFASLTRPFESASKTPEKVADVAKVAVIQGRFCLAYTSICSVCSERCPEPGAIQVTRGIPMVVADACTGCGLCHEVCPAPRNAILVLKR